MTTAHTPPTVRGGLLSRVRKGLLSDAADRRSGGLLTRIDELFPNLRDRLSNNYAGLGGLSAGLLSGGAHPWSAGMSGFLAGNQADLGRRDQQREQERQEQLRQAVMAGIGGLGSTPPGLSELAAASPEFGAQYLANAWAQPTTPDLPNSWREYSLTTSNPTPEGYAAFLNPPDSETNPSSYREYQLTDPTPTPDEYAQFLAARSGGMTLSIGPDGSVTYGPASGSGGRPTDANYTSNLYAQRMEAADQIISQFSDAGQSLVQRGLNQVPIFGNFWTSPEFQQFDQAARDFINAVLRRESGAVISDAEFANAKRQYLPQPGDGPEVLAQKAENRRIAIEGIRNAAGPAYAGSVVAAPQPASGGSMLEQQNTATPSGQQGGAAPEGTIILMPDGSLMVKQDGQWVPYAIQ